MESLRGPINSFFFEEGMNSECLESGPLSICSAINTSDGGLIPRHHYQQMPFLQMLHGAMQAEEEAEEEEGELRLQLRRQEQALFNPYPAESNLQLLLRLQDQRHCSQNNWAAEVESARAAVDQHDSCITHASESQSDGRGADHLLPCLGDAAAAAAPVTTERKRRKRPRAAAAAAAPSKKAEEVESQRMNHIAVERNRRRLMNDHLVALRSLMPPSFVQRGDQASIIGGAIDFVKELEQHLHSLQAEKRMRTSSAAATSSAASSPCTTLSRSSEEDACHAAQPTTEYLHGGFFVAPQYTTYSRFRQRRGEASTVEEVDEGVDVEATVVQGHVNLKVAGRRREGQLVRAIAAMEELRLSVLHLNITSLDPASILYSLNLKMEDGCKLGSADEIATAVHQIFAYITAC